MLNFNNVSEKIGSLLNLVLQWLNRIVLDKVVADVTTQNLVIISQVDNSIVIVFFRVEL